MLALGPGRDERTGTSGEGLDAGLTATGILDLKGTAVGVGGRGLVTGIGIRDELLWRWGSVWVLTESNVGTAGFTGGVLWCRRSTPR